MCSKTSLLTVLVTACALLQGSSARDVSAFRHDAAVDKVAKYADKQTFSGFAVPLGKAHHHDAPEVTHDAGLSKTEVHVPWTALPIAGTLVCSIIIFIYGPQGASVVTSVLIYLLSLTTMKLSVKWVFLTHEYPFAKFVSSLHFLAGGLVMYAVLKQRQTPIPRPSLHEFSVMICPIALAVVLSIGANNMALVFSTAAFTEIIGATNCLVTIAMVMLMGMPIDKWLILPAGIVVAGCALGVSGELNFSLAGMLLCLSANIFRSMKVALQQKLMTGASKDKFDPTVLLFWISWPSATVMLLGSFLTEGMRPYSALMARGPSQLHGLVFAILISCVNATILNLAQLYVTKDLGAVGGQLVAQSKMVLTVLGGMVLFGETFSQLEFIGFALALVGVYTFTRMDQAFKEREKKAVVIAKETSPNIYQAQDASTAKSQ